MIGAVFVTGIVWFFYQAIAIAHYGRTLGMSWLKIRPVRIDGSPLSRGRAFGRAALFYLALFLGWIGLLDFLWCLWDENRQCLHDKAVDSLVIVDGEMAHAPSVSGGPVNPPPLATSRRRHPLRLLLRARPGSSLDEPPGCPVEFGEDLADDLGRLMSGEWVAAFRLGHLGGEVLHRVDSADQDVAQRFAAGLGIVERFERGLDLMLGRLGHGMDQRHGFFAAARRGDGRLAIGVLLLVPLGQRLVVPALTRMQQSGPGFLWRRVVGCASLGRCVGSVFALMLAFRGNGHDECAVVVAHDIHGSISLVMTPEGVTFSPYPPWRQRNLRRHETALRAADQWVRARSAAAMDNGTATAPSPQAWAIEGRASAERAVRIHSNQANEPVTKRFGPRLSPMRSA